MQLHQLKSTISQSTKKRVGRGGKRGKTSGRGHKGQKARAGNSSRPEIRDMIKRLPKLRGHGINRAKSVNSSRRKSVPVNVSSLETAFATGSEVNPASLVEVGVIGRVRKRVPKVKILGSGEVTKSFTVSGCAVSEAAKTKLEAAGGKVI